MYKFLSRAAITASIHLKYCVSGFQHEKSLYKASISYTALSLQLLRGMHLALTSGTSHKFCTPHYQRIKRKKIWKKAKIKIKKKFFH